MAILEKLIILTLILFPFGELIRINITRDITLHPVDISVFLIFITWIVVNLKNKRDFLKIDLFKPFAVFSIVCVISLLFNLYWLKPLEAVVSFLYFERWVSYASVFFAVRDFHKLCKKKIILRLLIIDGLIILVLGFLQLFFFPSLIPYIKFGWDKHMYRMFTVFLDPNFAGTFFVLYLLLTATLAFENFSKKNLKPAIIYGIISGMTLIAVYLTYSRTALLMLLITFILFFILIKKFKFIALLIGVTIIYVVIIYPKFYIENMNLLRVNSSIARIDSAKEALQIIVKNPVLGTGFNTYRYAQVKYKFRSENQKIPNHADAGSDNSFLFVTATTGFIGLISYLYIWFCLIKKIYLKNKDKNYFYGILILVSALGLGISALFINSLFFGPLILWMWILMGIIDSK